MTHRREAVQHGADDTLGGRVRRQQLGVGRLQGLQLLEKLVVFGIGDLRCIEHVVTVGMVVQLVAQLGGAPDSIGIRAHGDIVAARPSAHRLRTHRQGLGRHVRNMTRRLPARVAAQISRCINQQSCFTRRRSSPPRRRR